MMLKWSLHFLQSGTAFDFGQSVVGQSLDASYAQKPMRNALVFHG